MSLAAQFIYRLSYACVNCPHATVRVSGSIRVIFEWFSTSLCSSPIMLVVGCCGHHGGTFFGYFPWDFPLLITGQYKSSLPGKPPNILFQAAPYSRGESFIQTESYRKRFRYRTRSQCLIKLQNAATLQDCRGEGETT